MKFPSLPTNSHQGTTLNFEKLQKVLPNVSTPLDQRYLRLPTTIPAKPATVAFGAGKLPWAAKSKLSEVLTVTTGLTTVLYVVATANAGSGEIGISAGISGGKVTFQGFDSREEISGTEVAFSWIAIGT
jgi:hypothetical protein